MEMTSINLKNPTVAELIEVLKKMPQDKHVYTDDGSGWLTGEIVVRYDVYTDKEIEIVGS